MKVQKTQMGRKTHATFDSPQWTLAACEHGIMSSASSDNVCGALVDFGLRLTQNIEQHPRKWFKILHWFCGAYDAATCYVLKLSVANGIDSYNVEDPLGLSFYCIICTV